mmetsp:Transcript_13018/g.17004  ORF Transcript_13018/g.17004 Transcript_13018/m.17004 type:complete len:417 (-) Transcript_13018:292-1542(-)|eukprot:CAMPEP_0116062888 /NCGR_PEP_ID=MMETSP0322-20121206/8054_1 /TAXON_ID=163516 /ORGANISM="Leptocylindrus danicus var. apora, Strain B651" /LENGTH=416 /DNA_ID=CAMNT_0003548335 /DNA_START=324 /DNA_END=1574 /DNA_ORIENTATION=+
MNTSNTNNTNTNQVPPLSAAAQAALESRSHINLDDIFGDCFFTPEGETIFLNDTTDSVRSNALTSSETEPAPVASKENQQTGTMNPVAVNVPPLGTTNTGSTLRGEGYSSAANPALTTADRANRINAMSGQQPNHMKFISTLSAGSSAEAVEKKRKVGGGAVNLVGAVGGGSRPVDRHQKMSEQQKVERRERNREHAKRSRIRKKFLLESLQQSVKILKDENDKLRNAIRSNLPAEEAEEAISAKNLASESIIADGSTTANKVLDDPDFRFIKALQTAQQNFVVTDPSLPDNPIVYATQGFLNLTGYSLDQVLGRNCRFLQGPETDPKAVEKIRNAIETGNDMSVCLLNYRVDGTTFWNQFFIAALRDANSNITNYVGVQCKVSDQYAANVCKKQEEGLKAFDATEEIGDSLMPTQ